MEFVNGQESLEEPINMEFVDGQQSLIEQQINSFGLNGETVYYVWREDGNYMLLYGESPNESSIQTILLPSAIQIAYLVNTATDLSLIHI